MDELEETEELQAVESRLAEADLSPIPSRWPLYLMVPILGFALVMQLVDLKKRAGAAEGEIRNEAAIASVNNAKEDYKRQQVEWNGLVEAGRERLATARKEEAAALATVRDLEKKSQAARTDVEEARQQRESVKADVETLKSQLETFQADLSVVKGELKLAQSETKSARDEARRLNESNATSQASADNLKKEVSSLEASLAGLKQQTADLDKLLQQRNQLAGEIAKLEGSLQAVKKSIASEQSVIGDLEKENQRLETKRKSLVKTIQSLEQQVAEKEAAATKDSATGGQP